MSHKTQPEGACVRRQVCSDLVWVHWEPSGKQERTESAVLEEIGPDGAVVQFETEVAAGTEMRLDCGMVDFSGVVRECRREQELGYFTEIEFHEGQRWAAEVYEPKHLLDLSKLTPQPCECEQGCSTADWCPTEYVARAVEPRSSVNETVRRVAQNLASVCGALDAEELAKSFLHYFGAPRTCHLFGAFTASYRDAREDLTGRFEPPVSPLRQAFRIAELLAGLPDEALRYPSGTSEAGRLPIV